MKNDSKTSTEARLIEELSYSQRERIIDNYFMQLVFEWKPHSRVLYFSNAQSKFDISQYDLIVMYLDPNVSEKTDTQAISTSLQDSTFDYVICRDLLEPLPQLSKSLQEIYRILKPNGQLIVTVPFLMPLNEPPHSEARYTHHYWKKLVEEVNFREVQIQRQGLFWSVIVEMLRSLVYDKATKHPPRSLLIHYYSLLLRKGMQWALNKEATINYRNDDFYNRFILGYAIHCTK